ncbi:oligosaccharide flippase family protein [Patescibacteria group bacterium]|nr:oligosaccharide flippase family protein [Patescibacteria group bacterium]
MIEKGHSGALARNTSIFITALVGQKIVSFLYFTFLARLLGPSDIGKYVLALSLTTIFSVLLDLGLAQLLTRQVARDQACAGDYLKSIIGFKLSISLVVIALVVGTAHLLGYPVVTLQLVYLASLLMVLDSFTLTAYSLLRGLHVLTWESIGTVAMQLLVAILGLAVSLVSQDLRLFMVALLAASLFNMVFALYQIRKRFNLSLKPNFAKKDWWQLANLVWPFTLAAVLTRLYGSIDTVLLSVLSDDRAVGLYSVPYKVTYAFQFIPSAFAATLFPGFSTFFKTAKDKLGDIFVRGVVYLTALGWPISLGIAVLAPKIIDSLYPDYHESILPLQILIMSLAFLFVTFPVGSLLPACDRQKRHTFNIALATVFNIILNLFLIPLYGAVGAAVAAWLSTLLLLVAGWLVVGQVIDYDKKFLYSRLIKIGLAGLLMAAVVLLLINSFNFVVVILIGAICYGILLVLWGGITLAEIRQLWSLIKRKAV